MYESIVELQGGEPGPTSMILAGVHGNERCGVEALEKMLPTLQIKRGRVFIGYGNPRAIEQNVRFVDTNLNRLFRPESELSEKEKSSYEYSRAVLLKTYLDQADALLDVHASLTPNSQRFVIAESNAQSITSKLPFTLVVSGFDEAQPGGTDYYMNQRGKVGICVECGYFADEASTSGAEESIRAFLLARGHIDGDTQTHPQSLLQIMGQYITKNDTFTLRKEFADFEEVSAGEVVGVDGTTEVYMPVDGVILFARNATRVGGEAFVYGQYRNKA